MKLVPTLLILSIIALYAVNATSLHKKSKNKHTSKQARNPNPDNMRPIDTTPQSVQTIMYGDHNERFNKDRSFLWKDYNVNKYDRPYYHGVVGPQFPMPYSEEESPYNYISSPAPRNTYSRRIIANEIGPRTLSHSSFDMPLRENVVQIETPIGITRTKEFHIDPRYPPMGPVSTSKGSLYHNTGNVDPAVNHGFNNIATAENNQTIQNPFASFLEKSGSKKTSSKNAKKKINPMLGGMSERNQEIMSIRNEAVNEAHNAERRAQRLIDAAVDMNTDGKMILDMKLPANKLDRDIGLHPNDTRREYVARMLRHPIGVMAINSRRFLPPKDHSLDMIKK